MSQSSENRLFDEIHEFVTARIFNRLSEAQLRRFERLLESSPEARQLYVSYLQQTIGLQSMLGSSLTVSPVVGLEDPGPAPRKSASRPAGGSSPVLGFLHSILHVGGASTAATVTWVFAVLCTGLAAVMFIVGGGFGLNEAKNSKPEKLADAASGSRDGNPTLSRPGPHRSNRPSPTPDAAEASESAAVGGQLIVRTGPRSVHVDKADSPGGANSKGSNPVAIGTLEPFQIYGTGAGLNPGVADTHWEITSISSDPPPNSSGQAGPEQAGKPRPAVTFEPPASFFRDPQGQAHWISFSQTAAAGTMYPGSAGKCRLTFRTRFDLSGFEPSTARISGVLGASRYLVSLHLNGSRFPLPDTIKHMEAQTSPVGLDITEGFVPGVNVLEFVVENDGAAQGSGNVVGLFMDWTGKAKKKSKLSGL
jgi:hypothetical protein